MGCVSPPLSLIKNRTDDFGASLTLLGRKYLQPSSHVPATILARTCNRPRTYLREKMPCVESLPMFFY